MATYTISMSSITCNQTSDLNAHDEVWILYQIDAGAPLRYPYEPRSTVSMAPGDVLTFGADDHPPLQMTYEHDVSVTLYDQDSRIDLGLTDFLGTRDFGNSSNAASEPTSATVTNGDSSSYTLVWKIENWGA